MREGAVDCLEKPIDEQALLNLISRATDLYRMKRAEHQRHLELRERECTLTPREREVFALITNGLLNKQVGAALGATERTIKTHRGRVMDKMNAGSLADLVRMAEILQTQPIFDRLNKLGHHVSKIANASRFQTARILNPNAQATSITTESYLGHCTKVPYLSVGRRRSKSARES